MRRYGFVLGALLAAACSWALAVNPFDQKLSPDRQIVQALNRLTFGPRPGDVEQVRQIGLNKWIEQQLHPDQIPENPLLAERLKPLASLDLSLDDIARDYLPQPANTVAMMITSRPTSLNDLLPQADMRKVLNGTAEERTAVLKGLDPDKRKEVLAVLPPNVVEFTPDYKQEADEARRMRQEEQQQEIRKRNPPLNELLNPDQLAAINTGGKEQIAAVLAFLDPARRRQALNMISPQRLNEMPELRREKQMLQQPRLVVGQDLREAKVLRAIYSNRQLEEVLVDFWANHFNVDASKSLQAQSLGAPNILQTLIGGFERDAIRPHVLGKFKDLLLATARHPAMLYYLDNWESVAGGAFEVGPFAPRRGNLNGVPNSILPGPLSQVAHGINENYGREVMELHTLGVKGGYTQDDVINVARCFTGWTVRDAEHPDFVFANFMHDSGEKTVLGHKIPAGRGEQDGLDVIDILAHHPSTAKFISRELAQRFVADDPPQALVDRMAQTFVKTDGDLRAVLETMFGSTEFFSEGAWQAKIKSPLEMAVSAVRAMDADTADAFTLVQKIADLGQPLYNKLEPTGYPNTGETWLGTQGLLERMKFAASLASGAVSGVIPNTAALSGKEPAALAHDLLGHDPSPATEAALEQGLAGKDSPPPFIASLILGSPDFQRR